MSLLPGEALLHDERLAGTALEISEGDMALDRLPLISVLPIVGTVAPHVQVHRIEAIAHLHEGRVAWAIPLSSERRTLAVDQQPLTLHAVREQIDLGDVRAVLGVTD